MGNCSESEYRQFVDRIADLCSEGFASDEYCKLFHVDFAASREELLNAYQGFVTCCNWLNGCSFDDYATHFSPDSQRVKAKIEASSGRPILNGSLIAAVMFLDLPHVMLGNSPNISIAVSRFCARFHASATISA